MASKRSAVVGALLLGAALSGCAHGSPPPDGGVMTVSATFTLTDPDTYTNACIGMGQYQDINLGTQVDVLVAGVVVGNTVLGTGVRSNDGSCLYGIKVTGVPTGKGVYTIQVGQRGAVDFTQNQASSLTLGVA